MVRWFDLPQNRFNSLSRINEKGSALGSHVFFTVHTLLNPHLIRIHYFMIRIAQQRERKSMFLNECLVAFGTVDTYSEQFGLGLNFAPGIPHAARLSDASRSIVFWIEVKYKSRSRKIGELHFPPLPVDAADGRRFEPRSGITNFKFRSHKLSVKLSRLMPLRNPLHNTFTGDRRGDKTTLQKVAASRRFPVDHFACAKYSRQPAHH